MISSRDNWPEAMATVLSCTYDVRAGRAMAFGLPSSKHFRIAYNYWADDALHTGELFSEKAIPQGNIFPIRYDPDAVHKSHDARDADAAEGTQRQPHGQRWARRLALWLTRLFDGA